MREVTRSLTLAFPPVAAAALILKYYLLICKTKRSKLMRPSEGIIHPSIYLIFNLECPKSNAPAST
jgi:hypothetical protein